MGQEPLSTIRQLELSRQLQRVANHRAEEESRLQKDLAEEFAKVLWQHAVPNPWAVKRHMVE